MIIIKGICNYIYFSISVYINYLYLNLNGTHKAVKAKCGDRRAPLQRKEEKRYKSKGVQRIFS